MSKDAQIESLTEEIKAAREALKTALKIIEDLTKAVQKGGDTRYIPYVIEKPYRPYPYYPNGPYWYYQSTTTAPNYTINTTAGSGSYSTTLTSGVLKRSTIRDDDEGEEGVAV